MRPGSCIAAVVVGVGLALCAAGCGKSTPTTPTTTTTTTTTTPPPTSTEDFAGTLPVGGSRFYSFTVAASGTVNITLVSVSGATVPSTVQLGLSIGSPGGTDCVAASSVTVAASSTPQVTGTYAPGVYCARVFDVGNLFAQATFDITIDHP